MTKEIKNTAVSKLLSRIEEAKLTLSPDRKGGDFILSLKGNKMLKIIFDCPLFGAWLNSKLELIHEDNQEVHFRIAPPQEEDREKENDSKN